MDNAYDNRIMLVHVSTFYYFRNTIKCGHMHLSSTRNLVDCENFVGEEEKIEDLREVRAGEERSVD